MLVNKTNDQCPTLQVTKRKSLIDDAHLRLYPYPPPPVLDVQINFPLLHLTRIKIFKNHLETPDEKFAM
jgi:hypothetical protein